MKRDKKNKNKESWQVKLAALFLHIGRLQTELESLKKSQLLCSP